MEWEKFIIITKNSKQIITSVTNNFENELLKWDKYIKAGEKHLFLLKDYKGEFGKISEWGGGHRYPFYDSKEWKELRSLTIKLYGCKCMKCGNDNIEMHVDHITPRSICKHRELDLNNLQVLCKPCNMEKMNHNKIDYRTDNDILKLREFIKLNYKYKRNFPGIRD